MSSTATSLSTLAFFGGTAGIGLSTLKLALAAGHTVNVLARTPSKLSSLSTQYPNTLNIIQGDIRDISALRSTLIINDRIVDVVISSIGMVLRREGLHFGAADTTICEDGTKAIFTALKELENEKKIVSPTGGARFVFLSTTGISSRGRDIPYAMMPLYHWVLAVPHEDKKKMEEVIVEEGKERRWVVVRPSFLADGDALGLEKIRVSTEVVEGEPEGKEELTEKVAIGYTIRRDDVGLWIFENCIKSAEKGAKWEGKMVTLTY